MNTSQTIQSIPLEKIGIGDYFFASFSDILGANATKKWSILVGVDDIYLGYEFLTSNRCFLNFNINSNTTGSTSSQPFKNANHNSSKTTDVELVTGLSGSDGNVWQRSTSAPGLDSGISGSEIGARSEYFVLSANSTHVLAIKNDEASTLKYSIRVGFYPVLP